MILIAESGASKTQWTGLEEGKNSFTFTSAGFNPVIQNREQISSTIKEEIYPYTKGMDVEKIFFYGAGCSTEENKKLMFSSFKNFFNKAAIEIEHDLLAAARGLWNKKEGIVTILGTGSNSCVFDGKDIIEEVPSLGYILGDEGSGAYMGKKIVKDYLYKKLPKDLMEKLRREYQLDREKVLQKVYKGQNPNRWLASFSVFIRENINNEYCAELVRNSFRDFFDCHVSKYNKYKDLPFGAVGSIAFHYKDFLKEVATEHGFTVKKIIKSPIDELVKYHTTLEKIKE